jgi:hypothetical protein
MKLVTSSVAIAAEFWIPQNIGPEQVPVNLVLWFIVAVMILYGCGEANAEVQE